MKKMIIMLMMVTLLVTLIAGCAPSDTDAPSATTMASSTTMATTIAPTATAATTSTSAPSTTAATTAAMGKYIDVTPMEAKALIEKTPGIIIIDVSPKYAEGHLPGAINYYAGDGSLDKAIPTLDKTKTYLVYCHVDSVSILGAQKLIDAGFSPVYRLAGNYAAWVDAGYAVEK